MQQGLRLEEAYGNAVTSFILGTLQPDTDLALVGYSAPDEFQHQFLGLITPTDMDGTPNPCYDRMKCKGDPECRVFIREGYIRGAYGGADAKLGLATRLMGGNPTVFAGSGPRLCPELARGERRKNSGECRSAVHGADRQLPGRGNAGPGLKPVIPGPQCRSIST